jgi:hypothetical protein
MMDIRASNLHPPRGNVTLVRLPGSALLKLAGLSSLLNQQLFRLHALDGNRALDDRPASVLSGTWHLASIFKTKEWTLLSDMIAPASEPK